MPTQVTAIYSVWNAARKDYDYYASTEGYRPFAPNRKLVPESPLGTTAERAAWPLPGDAELVGHGALAKGAIAERWAQRQGFGFGASDNVEAESFGHTIAPWILGGLIVWWLVKNV